MTPERIELPERPDLINGTNVSGLFADSLVRWRADIADVFNPDKNEHATWPPEDPRRLFEYFSSRPKLAVEMALELSTMILEIEREDGVFLEKKTYAHQLAHLKWLALSLLRDGTTYLIEGAPGTGKTLVLGSIMAAATRLQMRGLMNDAVMYATHKPFILAQQTFNAHDRRLRLIQPPDPTCIRQEVSYIQKLVGSETLFPRNVWRDMRKERHTRDAALRAIETHLRASPEGQDVLSTKSELLDPIVRLMTGDAVLVYDVDADMMHLPLSPAEVTDDETVGYYSGDIGRGIPRSYVDQQLVASRKGADVHGVKLDCTKNGQSLDGVRVVLTTAPTILMRGMRHSIQDILGRTGIIIVDEGRNAATAFQDAVREASGKKEKPLVFAASALSTTNGLASRPYADSYSPRLTIAAAMEPGPDGHQVLPNIGVDMFPGRGNALYHSSTVEAVHQFVEAHFTDLPLPEREHLPQLYLCTSIIVVSGETLAETVRMLRQEYRNRGIAADVIPFCKHPEKSGAGNTQYPYSERVLQAMMDSPEESADRRVRVMVAGPDSIKDALSIPTLQNVTVATAKGISKNVLLRILGRLQHSNKHRAAGPAHRVYFRQGLYQDTKAEETVFQLLGEHTGSSMQWVPLQILKGDHGAEADRKRVTGLPSMSVPLSDEELGKRRAEKGMRVKTLELHRLHVESNGHVPRSAAAEAVQSSAVWSAFDPIIARALPLWHDTAARKAFCDIAIERMRTDVVPDFMVAPDIWPTWNTELMLIAFRHAHVGPQAILDALKERITAAAQLGRVEEEVIPGEYIPLKDEVHSPEDDEEIESAETEEEDVDEVDEASIEQLDEVLAEEFDDEDDIGIDLDETELIDSLHIGSEEYGVDDDDF